MSGVVVQIAILTSSSVQRAFGRGGISVPTRSDFLGICRRDELRYSGNAMARTVKSTKPNHRPLAVVTGASSGIGYYLAKECAENGFDLLIAADDPKINDVARDFRALGTLVDAIETIWQQRRA